MLRSKKGQQVNRVQLNLGTNLPTLAQKLHGGECTGCIVCDGSCITSGPNLADAADIQHLLIQSGPLVDQERYQ